MFLMQPFCSVQTIELTSLRILIWKKTLFGYFVGTQKEVRSAKISCKIYIYRMAFLHKVISWTVQT